MKPWQIFPLAVFVTTVAVAAEIAPPAPGSHEGKEQRPETAPAQPPPPPIDPGIQRRPPTVPDPRSAVPPPNVDPEMAVNPDIAPPAREGGNIPRGPESEHNRPQ